MLYIMGLGLRGVSSLTNEENYIIRNSSTIYFETYTSISPESTVSELERIYTRNIELADREFVEDGKQLIELSRNEDVVLIVTGDPLSATTHNQLRADAMDEGVEVEVIENASILSVVPGKIGLFPYRMGPPVSLPFLQDKFHPKSVLEKIQANRDSGFHTILLLDLKDGRTMFPREAIEILLELEERHGQGVISGNTEVFSLSKVSQKGERLIFDTAENILNYSEDLSPSVLVMPAELNHSEAHFASRFNRKCSYFR